jgi:excisionase family DNA binding protein
LILAARLGVSVRTIDNLLTRGLPHLKLTCKLTRFPRAAVDEWLAERQVRRS